MADPRELRNRLADALIADGTIYTPEVEAAVRKVPRHLFVPEVSLRAAYADDVVVTKRDSLGEPLSSVSAPQMQAFMLEEAAIRPGMRCLEIGSGGYNAALMAELAGPGGSVVSVDIDPDVVARARRCLRAAGYDDVTVLLTDAESGAPRRAPYDRIIVTAAAWDIPPAWTAQLADDGRIVVPLRLRGLTRSLTLEREAGHLISRGMVACGFVRMQGAGEHAEQQVALRGGEVWLRFDDGWAGLDARGLRGVLDTWRAEAWSGAVVSRMTGIDDLQLWLATAFEGFCLIAVDPMRDSGMVTPAHRTSGPGAVSGHSLGYLVLRAVDDERVELGAHAFGPQAEALAASLAAEVAAWDWRRRTLRPGPEIRVFAVGGDEPLPAGLVIRKRHVEVVVSWP